MNKIENNSEKLTTSAARGYHGNMENKPEGGMEKIVDKELVKNTKDKPRFSANPTIASKENKGPQVEDRSASRSQERPLTDAEKRRILKFRRGEKDESEDESEKKGLWSMLLDLLASTFSDITPEDLEKNLEKSETMRGIRAYDRVKPREKWGAKDYARVIFVLDADSSKEASVVKGKLGDEARGRGIDKQVFSERATIENSHLGQSKEGDYGISKQNRGGEAAHRAIQVNYDLWREMGREGKVADLGEEQLVGFERDIQSLMLRGENGSKDQEVKAYLMRNSQMARKMRLVKEGRLRISGGSGPKEVVEVEFTGETKDFAEKLLKHAGKIEENTTEMLVQLQYINDKLDNIQKISIQNLMSNSADLKKYQKAYGDALKTKFHLESKLGELADSEKTVVGGERDKELYEGNIDQALEERMRRIEYLIAKSHVKVKGGDIDWATFDPGSESMINPNVAGIDPEKRKERKEFLERMKKVKLFEELEGDGLAKQEGLYFQELQRWVENILKNTELGYKGHRGKLKMESKYYDAFKKIREIPSNLYDYGTLSDPALAKATATAFETDLLKNVRELRGERKFLDYFRGISYLNYEGKGIDPRTLKIESNFGYPNCLEATMMLIANDKGPKWRTGGEFALIDAEGKFHRENFLEWMREEMIRVTGLSPVSGVNFLKEISFKAGYSQISLYDILFLSQYTQHQEVVMSGDASDLYKASGGEEQKRISRWGEPSDHPDMLYDTRTDNILTEVWQAEYEHNDSIRLQSTGARKSPEKWVEEQEAIAAQNNYTRSGLWASRFMIPAQKGDEVRNCYEKKEQGSLGQAVASGTLFYRHLTELTEKYMRKDVNGRMRVAEFGDNMAYKTLGHNGASVFWMTAAENALGLADSSARGEIKEAYRGFILKQVDDIENVYKSQMGGDKEKENNMKFLIENVKEGINDIQSEDIKISFDSFDKLVDFRLKIETVVLGKREVGQQEKEKFELRDKAVTRKEMEDEIRRMMRGDIKKSFFDVIGKSEIGEREVLLDDDKNGVKGRIITEEEWKKMGGIGANKTTVGAIMEEFGDNFVKDGESLENYEEDYKKAVNEGKMGDFKKKYDDIFRRHENLGLAILTKVMNMPRKQLNIFNSSMPSEEAVGPILKGALTKALIKNYGLNDKEGEYAHIRIWYPLDHMEIAGFNNTSQIPGSTQVASWYSRTMEARNAAMGTGELGGSKDTLEEFRALRLPTFLERIRVRKPGEEESKHMLIDILQGGEGREMKPYWERKLKNSPDKNYWVAKNAEHNDVIDGLSPADKFRQLIVKETHMPFQKMVYIDPWGVTKVDPEKAREAFDAWWNQIRLVYNSQGIDFNAKISMDGREVSVRDYMWGKDVQKTADIIVKHYEELARRGGADAEAYGAMAENMKSKPALAAFMNLLTIEIHEHRDFDSAYDQLSAGNVGKIWWILDHYLHDRGEFVEGQNYLDTRIEDRPSMMPYELFNKLLGVHKNKKGEEDSMEKFIFDDLWFAFIVGLIQGISGMAGEIEDELVQVKKVYIGH